MSTCTNCAHGLTAHGFGGGGACLVRWNKPDRCTCERFEAPPEEVLWASRIPLHAAATVGKVHLWVPGSARTLCGVRVGRPSMRFTPGQADARCQRCQKVVAS